MQVSSLVKKRKITLLGVITGASRPRGSPRLLPQDNSSLSRHTHTPLVVSLLKVLISAAACKSASLLGVLSVGAELHSFGKTGCIALDAGYNLVHVLISGFYLLFVP